VTAPAPAVPALYECEIRHVRTAPLTSTFRYGSYSWLVDLDDLPRLPWWLRPLAGFRAGDHLGEPDRSIGANVTAFLSGNGVELAGGRVLMLASPRVFGYVFNPLSVFWCYRADGSLACVLAEVHNTYGQRHCYLVRTDARGRAQVDKEFYVSPFNPVDGQYQMSLPAPGKHLTLTITLHRPGAPPFVATMRGIRRDATAAALLRAAFRHPWPTLVTTIRIHARGIRLWARGLPVVPRPAHRPQKGVQ
jgi:DUF1365 family protein